MRKFCLDLRVKTVEKMNDRHVLIKLTHNQLLPEMQAGQFVEVRVDHSPDTFLRRPISINWVDREHNELWLLVAIVGQGTRQMAQLKAGELLNCVLPLGKGFTLPSSDNERFLLVGGGVGVAPLLFLGRQMRKRGVMPTFLLGERLVVDGGIRTHGTRFRHHRRRHRRPSRFRYPPSGIGKRDLRPHLHLRTDTHDAGCSALCAAETNPLRGVFREYDGLWHWCMSVLCGEDNRRKPLRLQRWTGV